jgi:hypothetical protein
MPLHKTALTAAATSAHAADHVPAASNAIFARSVSSTKQKKGRRVDKTGTGALTAASQLCTNTINHTISSTAQIMMVSI